MILLEKYKQYSEIAQTGDIILFRGNSILSKAIMYFSHGKVSHSAISVKGTDEIFVLQSTINSKSDGVQRYPFLKELQGDVDFMVLRIKGVTKTQILDAIQGVDKKIKEHYKYNILFYVQFLIYHYFGWDDTHITQKHAYVCSTLVQYFTDELGINVYRADKLITPADFIRLKPDNIDIIIPLG